MKKLSVFLLFLVLSSPAYAEKYRAVDDNGTVTLVQFIGEPEEAWSKNPLYGHRFVDIDSANLPDPADRNYWKLVGNSVVVDTAKKQADLDAKTQAQANAEAVFSKLKITKAEMKAAVEALK